MFYRNLMSFVLVAALGLCFSLSFISNVFSEENIEEENQDYEITSPEDYEYGEDELPDGTQDDDPGLNLEDENKDSEDL